MAHIMPDGDCPRGYDRVWPPGQGRSLAIDHSQRESRERSLWLELDEASRQRLHERATLPVLRASHVTIAHRVVPNDLAPALIPGGYTPGDVVDANAIALCSDERVQAVIVEIAGSTWRPFDGGTLHVTLSRVEQASSWDANAMLQRAERVECQIALRGVLRWIDV